VVPSRDSPHAIARRRLELHLIVGALGDLPSTDDVMTASERFADVPADPDDE
jgi:hypothetical protein